MAVHPPRRDDRIIIHFDYDCFYASVFEAEQPILKTLPLAVQQKHIVVTCNYEARRRGLRKLQLIKDAKRICPDVVIVLGEDLTRFRDASKELYRFLKGFIWGDRVEKLGFDEIFLDVTDMIQYNADLLNQNDLSHSFFYLNRQDPTVGFDYDATVFHGLTWPSLQRAGSAAAAHDDGLSLRLRVASHLAFYLRHQLEHQKGYTATVGISTCKVLSKLVGNVHKPNSQTTLLPPYVSDDGAVEFSNVLKFIDGHEIGQIPGIGSKIAHRLRDLVLGTQRTPNEFVQDRKVTVRDVRTFPEMGVSLLDRLIGGPGAPRDIGVRVWNLLHGVDDSEVLEARDIPTQISIEDSYLRLDTFDEVKKELTTLAASLIRRIRTDLTEDDDQPPDPTKVVQSASDRDMKTRWRAHPRTLRLSTRPRPAPNPDGTRTRSFNRISRSAPIPQFIFSLDESVDALAGKLVQESLLSMFRKLHPERSGWNLSLMNIAVTNMVETAGEHKNSGGRDIQKMFRTQDTVLSAWKVVDSEETATQIPPEASSVARCDTVSQTPSTYYERSPHPGEKNHLASSASWEESDEDEIMSSFACRICGTSVPQFAQTAHELYNSQAD